LRVDNRSSFTAVTLGAAAWHRRVATGVQLDDVVLIETNAKPIGLVDFIHRTYDVAEQTACSSAP
jgi:hypothetical protein